MVWDFEEPGAQQVRGAEQVGLRRTFHVAGQQRHACAVGDPQDQRGLVGLAVRRAVGPSRRGPENLDPDGPDRRALPGDRCHDRHGCARGAAEQAGHRREVAVERGDPDRADPTLVEHRGQAVGVVGVGVGQDDQVQITRARAPQPAGGPPVGAAVHQDPHAGRIDQQRVTLPDVDRGHDQCAGRDAQPDRRDDGRDRGSGSHDGRQAPATAGQQHPHCHREGGRD
ncbi:MAG: hypothetical protein M3N57_11155, partial [Actinomycetota bacterium]|nr:hypothetical protein [Actinomycetota bacterium]